MGAPCWETAGVCVEASESSVRSRWAGRLCRATLEGSIKWAAVGHRAGRIEAIDNGRASLEESLRPGVGGAWWAWRVMR